MSPASKSVLDILKNDHENVRKLFKKMLSTTTGAKVSRADLMKKIERELVPHMTAEEKLFYPFLEDHADEKTAVFEGFEEHAIARVELGRLKETAVEDEHWEARVKVLSELIDHHVSEEEDELFSMARKQMDPTQLQEMGKEIAAEKTRALDSM